MIKLKQLVREDPAGEMREEQAEEVEFEEVEGER